MKAESHDEHDWQGRDPRRVAADQAFIARYLPYVFVALVVFALIAEVFGPK